MEEKQVIKARTACVTLLLIASFSNLAYGHGWRTAADGCHNDRSTGSRHCHNGGSSSSDSSSSGNIQDDGKPTALPISRAGSCNGPNYNRDDWGYTGRSFSTNVGYYSGVACADGIDADHVLSLKDAHDSGGCAWSRSQKAQFSNDVANLVPSCSGINRSKGARLPAEFIRLSGDGSGVDFVFSRANMCAYLTKYKQVKDKYSLSLSQNDSVIFQTCGINL